MLTNKELVPGARVYLTGNKEQLENEAGILSKFPLDFNIRYTIRNVVKYEFVTLVQLCESGGSIEEWYSSSIFSTTPELQLSTKKSINIMSVPNKTISELFEEKVKSLRNE